MSIKPAFQNVRFLAILWTLTLSATACAQTNRVDLKVDATDAPRSLLRASMHISASPGKLTLLYPKWIPGEHGPTGPITDLVGLKMSAGGKAIPWQRDPEEMFAVNMDVPAGADGVDVSLEFLLNAGGGDFSSSTSSTAQLVCINWNQLLLYPKGVKASEINYAASIRLPNGWKYATALPVEKDSAPEIGFAPVSLETLVDSPLIAGAFMRTVDLSPGEKPSHHLHIVADSSAAVQISDEDAHKFANLVVQTGALFGARHYRDYHFLLTLSDHVGHFGLEHHQSSDDRVGENTLTDPDTFKLNSQLLPHEMVHSWNGKYRRPAGIATPDFQQPMKTELLWVYEGLTEYLGVVLAARSGLLPADDTLQGIALDAATLDYRGGRKWRPLADTTIAAQLLYEASRNGQARRRGVDFYSEGELIWLEADVLIRQQTKGQKSLNDFCRKFYGGESGDPKVVPYSLDDLLAALNDVCPCDWRQFFQKRVYEINPRAPLGGIENGGWKLSYSEYPSEMLKSLQGEHENTDLSFSLGISIGNKEGIIGDVIPDSPADKAGIGPGMKLIAVNGRHWNSDILRNAITAAKKETAPIELLIENQDYFKTYKLDYHDGERYPMLERDTTKPDLLDAILSPLTSSNSK